MISFNVDISSLETHKEICMTTHKEKIQIHKRGDLGLIDCIGTHSLTFPHSITSLNN